jgi:hypothetical protein
VRGNSKQTKIDRPNMSKLGARAAVVMSSNPAALPVKDLGRA